MISNFEKGKITNAATVEKATDFVKYFAGNEWILPTDERIVEKAADELEKRLRVFNAGGKTVWEEDDINTITSGFREVLVNAIGHGNMGLKNSSGNTELLFEKMEQERRQTPTAKKVKVSITLDALAVEFIVEDEGAGFDPIELEDPTDTPNILKNTGRGIFFLKHFFDKVEITRIPGSGMKVVAMKYNPNA